MSMTTLLAFTGGGSEVLTMAQLNHCASINGIAADIVGAAPAQQEDRGLDGADEQVSYD